MDEQSNYIPVKTKGSILNIKPIEELEKVEPKEPEPEPEQETKPDQAYDDMEPDIEDLKKDEIFMRPEKPKKKKKELSERQKAHMARLNQLRIERLAKKKKEKEAKEAKKKPKPVKPFQKAAPTPAPAPTPTPAQAPAQAPNFDLNQSNQAYMNQFFNNMNMFMESYNKLNSIKQKQQPPATPVQTVRKTIKKPVQKPTRVAQPNFRTPVVPHYKNPWGIYDP